MKMPIEVKADLCRGSVFLAGETVECVVTFANVENYNSNSNANRLHNSISSSSVCLAWASVQIHCQCTVSEARIKLMRSMSKSTEDASSSGCNTSFVPNIGEHGITVMSTTPKVLFCDLKLLPGQSKTFFYSDTLPRDCPPSYKSQAIKYTYKLTVGAQVFDHPTQILRVPFRVLVLYGLNDLSVYTDTEEVAAPTNPFIKNQTTEHSILDIAMQVLGTVTARKGPYTYNITNARGNVAKFSLFKLAYKLGEDIVGMFDFSQSTVPCVQYSVSLESEEQISEEHRRTARDNTTITSYSKHLEMCVHTDKTHFCIPVPLTASPAFITDIVCLRWRLHFEFVTSCEELSPHKRPLNPDEVSTWQGPATLNVETMVWDLGIKIFPTNPMHASGVTTVKTGNTITI